MKPVASIIVPVRGLLGRTRRCLESLRRHTALSHEVIVVDNASEPATRRYLRRLERSGAVRMVRNTENRSFAASINQGLRSSRGDLLVWLNNDTVVTPEWLERLASCLERFPRAGAAGPCSNPPLKRAPRGARRANRGCRLPLRDLPAFTTAWSLRFDRQAAQRERLSGFCLAVRREAMEKVGPLDEGFLWGEEDEDYCLRLRQAGYALMLAKDVFVFHEGAATRGRWARARRRRLDLRNRTLLREKWARLGGALGRTALAVLREPL